MPKPFPPTFVSPELHWTDEGNAMDRRGGCTGLMSVNSLKKYYIAKKVIDFSSKSNLNEKAIREIPSRVVDRSLIVYIFIIKQINDEPKFIT